MLRTNQLFQSLWKERNYEIHTLIIEYADFRSAAVKNANIYVGNDVVTCVVPRHFSGTSTSFLIWPTWV
jgi:hypothetical protein